MSTINSTFWNRVETASESSNQTDTDAVFASLLGCRKLDFASSSAAKLQPLLDGLMQLRSQVVGDANKGDIEEKLTSYLDSFGTPDEGICRIYFKNVCKQVADDIMAKNP